MAWTSAQQTALAVMPKISSLLSLCGSTWILIEVLWGYLPNNHHHQRNGRSTRNVVAFDADNGKLKRQHPYHRLLLAMSVYDILESIWNFGSTWPLPADTPSDAGAFWQPIGTTQSCTAQGFFLELAVAIPIYNACLSLYYLLVINYRFTDNYIRKWIEPTMHAFAFIWGFGTAFAASVMGYMNNANLWCWIAPYPSGCLAEDNDIECTRGKRTFLVRWVFYFAPLWTSIFSATVFTLMVYFYVRKIDMKSSRYRARSDDTGSGYQSGNSQQSASRHLDTNSFQETSGFFQPQPTNNDAHDHDCKYDNDDDEKKEDPTANDKCNDATIINDNPQPPDRTSSLTDLRSFFTKDRVSFLGASVRFGGSSSWGLTTNSDHGNNHNNNANDDNNTGEPFGSSKPQLDPTLAARRQRFMERWRKRQEEQRRMHRRTIEVFHQAVFYMGAFYLTHIWSTSNRIIQHLNGGNTIYGLILIHSFFDPFQGFLNFLCYQRPRYLRERKQNAELGRWVAVQRILRFSFLPEPDVTAVTEALSSNKGASRSPSPQQSSSLAKKPESTTYRYSGVTLDTYETKQTRQSLGADMSSNFFDVPIQEQDDDDYDAGQLAAELEQEALFGPEQYVGDENEKSPEQQSGSSDDKCKPSSSEDSPSLDGTSELSEMKSDSQHTTTMVRDDAEKDVIAPPRDPKRSSRVKESTVIRLNGEDEAENDSQVSSPVRNVASAENNKQLASDNHSRSPGADRSEKVTSIAAYCPPTVSSNADRDVKMTDSQSQEANPPSGQPHDRFEDEVLVEVDPDLLEFEPDVLQECNSSGIWSV